MTPTSRRVIGWASLLVVVFLIGFVPPYVRANRSESELEAARRQIDQLQLRDAIGHVYFEATRKNYGLAGTGASRFFNDVRQAASRAGDPARRASLEQVLDFRDTVTAGLAKGDPSVLDALQAVYVKTRDATSH